MKKYKRTLIITGGIVSVGLGIIGIFIPVLPTTPFLLLAAYCFSKSSEKFHSRLLTNKWTGRYISNYLEGRGIAVRDKLVTLIFLWLMMAYSAIFVVDQLFFKILLFVIAVVVTIHLLTRKTYRPGRKKGVRVRSKK